MSTERIARFIVETNYDQIPREAVESAKRGILDCVGVTLAACEEEESKLMCQFVKEQEGKAQSGVIAAGFKAVASEAAWVNGTMAHALDYDDASMAFGGHPTVALLPAVLALGDLYNISGRDVILSYIVGFEAGARVGLAAFPKHYQLGWHTTSTMGSIGAVGCAAKILNLSVEQTQVALGIAASLAGGLKDNFGTMVKPLHAGNAARNGVVAALLAQRGFTANPEILNSKQGFLNVLGGGEKYDLDKQVETLGKVYTVAEPGLMLKPYPSCAGTHPGIDAAFVLRDKYNPKPSDITEIECRTSPLVAGAAIHHHPQTGLEGKFSLEYCVATALLEGEVGFKHFVDDVVKGAQVQDLVNKTHCAHPDYIEGTSLVQELTIKLRDGQELTHRVEAAKGNPENPLSWDEICTKFSDCARVALTPQDADRSLEILSKLEAAKEIAELMNILTFKRK